MTVAVLAPSAPILLPPPVTTNWSRMQITWQGWDGRLWNLTDPASGLFIVKGGVRGLGMLKPEHYRDRSPAVHGAYYRGTGYDSREVHLPIHLYSDAGSREWHEFDNLFWASMHPEREGILTVTVPGVSTRRLRLRVEDDGGWTPELDPGYFGWATYGVTLRADQPFWEGEELPFSWEASTLPNFHGGKTPGAPIIRIGRGQRLDNARVRNPGDVETWVEWTVHGPVPSGGASIVVDGHQITVPYAIPAGQFVRMRTNPTDLQVVNHLGQDVFDTMIGEWDPAPIPPTSSSPVSLSLSGGAGRVEMRLVPLHLRAW